MKMAFLASMALVFAMPCAAQEQRFEGPYVGTVQRVIDGDTFVAQVEIWPNLSSGVSVRLRGVDAPEVLRPGCEEERLQGTLARVELMELLPEGQLVELSDVGPDSFFGRIVADVDRVADERAFSVTILMERRGFLVPYERNQDTNPWCPAD
ncbi:hypothetical protein A8B78_15165 [Jannaschia sp. EhC01]|nr:hypothetical protein A8B78_15165 [Jannaschia sp. EhC01]